MRKLFFFCLLFFPFYLISCGDSSSAYTDDDSNSFIKDSTFILGEWVQSEVKILDLRTNNHKVTSYITQSIESEKEGLKIYYVFGTDMRYKIYEGEDRDEHEFRSRYMFEDNNFKIRQRGATYSLIFSSPLTFYYDADETKDWVSEIKEEAEYQSFGNIENLNISKVLVRYIFTRV